MNFLSILAAFDEKEIEQMRKQFRKDFDAKIAEEKEYCEKAKTEPMMNKEKATMVMNLLANCGTAWHVEALRRMVLTDFFIPEKRDLDERANMLMTDALKNA